MLASKSCSKFLYASVLAHFNAILSAFCATLRSDVKLAFHSSLASVLLRPRVAALLRSEQTSFKPLESFTACPYCIFQDCSLVFGFALSLTSPLKSIPMDARNWPQSYRVIFCHLLSCHLMNCWLQNKWTCGPAAIHPQELSTSSRFLLIFEWQR